MVLEINYNYCDVTKYFNGVYMHNGIQIDFQIIQILKLDLGNTELLSLDIVLNNVDYRRMNSDEINTIKDNIRNQFNKKFS